MARIDAVAVSFFGMSLCKDFNDYYLSIVVPSDLARASLLKNFLLAQNVCFGVRLEGWVAVIPVFFYKNKGLSVQRLVAMCLPPQFCDLNGGAVQFLPKLCYQKNHSLHDLD